jgi:hypothetical protein
MPKSSKKLDGFKKFSPAKTPGSKKYLKQRIKGPSKNRAGVGNKPTKYKGGA